MKKQIRIVACASSLLGLLVISCGRSPVRSPPKGGAFSATDLKATELWLADLTEAYGKALDESNVYRRDEAQKQVVQSIMSEVELGVKVRWTVEVLNVDRDVVRLSPRVTKQHTILWNKLIAADAKDDGSIASNTISIGDCISIEDARRLKKGDSLTIEGTLEEFNIWKFNDKPLLVFYQAKIINATAKPSL